MRYKLIDNIVYEDFEIDGKKLLEEKQKTEGYMIELQEKLDEINYKITEYEKLKKIEVEEIAV